MASVGNAAPAISKPRTARYLQSFSMEGKVCAITGAARGLGYEFAHAFVESGASQIAIIDLKEEDAKRAAKELVADFVGQGLAQPGELDVQGYGCNIADEKAVNATFDALHKHFGRLDTVVNSAGIVENYAAESYPVDRYKLLMSINVDGSWYVATHAAKLMLQNQIQGSIVLVSSMSSSIVNHPQTQAPYNFSKAAVKHMASSLAVEWASKGIRVNCLAPGYTLTKLTERIFETHAEGKTMRADWEGKTPMKRMGLPEDLKGAIVYLASDASKFTTGQELIADGGFTLI